MDRNAYKPGETANISLEMNNGSKAAIHHVTVQLLRRLRLGTRGNGWGFYKTDLLNSVELPGLQPGESRMDFAGRTLAFPLVSLPGPDGEPPVSLQAEVKGDIIECDYVIVSIWFGLVWIGFWGPAVRRCHRNAGGRRRLNRSITTTTTHIHLPTTNKTKQQNNGQPTGGGRQGRLDAHHRRRDPRAHLPHRRGPAPGLRARGAADGAGGKQWWGW